MANTISGPGSFSGPGNFTVASGGGVSNPFSAILWSHLPASVYLGDTSATSITIGQYESGNSTAGDLALWNQIPNGSTFTMTTPNSPGNPTTLTKTSLAVTITDGNGKTYVSVPVTFVSGAEFFYDSDTWSVSW